MGEERCLSREQIEQLRLLAPGQAPLEIAGHLAGCASCQQRALLDGQERRTRTPARPPSLERSFVLVAAVLLALAMFFFSVLKLAGLA